LPITLSVVGFTLFASDAKTVPDLGVDAMAGAATRPVDARIATPRIATRTECRFTITSPLLIFRLPRIRTHIC
jgi:hypothetical protein